MPHLSPQRNTKESYPPHFFKEVHGLWRSRPRARKVRKLRAIPDLGVTLLIEQEEVLP